ncbi:hypothetical protein EVAR_32048_1 [Eumeta japonica]|uniref:Uncharacterized protein n=1 Tax=Eumeta variegata TaxID=151549 RepID=A0A4C1WPP2_EUMVA|nr:hypothetical protein EVAR_32048_1 [Eumeta japonica]
METRKRSQQCVAATSWEGIGHLMEGGSGSRKGGTEKTHSLEEMQQRKLLLNICMLENVCYLTGRTGPFSSRSRFGYSTALTE